MCGRTTWVLLDGHSTLQALEGGLEALAYYAMDASFIRWHRMDKAKPRFSRGPTPAASVT